MGPCPICGEPVALYNSNVIGLRDKMQGGADSLGDIQAMARSVIEYINSQTSHSGAGEKENCDEDPGKAARVSPSIKNPIASPISDEEVEDFLKIDLKLLDKKEFFDRHFG